MHDNFLRCTNFRASSNANAYKRRNNGNTYFGGGDANQYDDETFSMSDSESTPPPPYSLAIQSLTEAKNTETIPLTSASSPRLDDIDEDPITSIGDGNRTSTAADQHLYEYSE